MRTALDLIRTFPNTTLAIVLLLILLPIAIEIYTIALKITMRIQ